MRILVVGLGSIGQRHVRNLRTLLGSSVELLAYRVRRLGHVITPGLGADATQDVEATYGLRVFTSLEEALREQPEVAFICNPSHLHAATALACLNAGCDVFIEKPVASSLDGADKLIALAEAKRRIVMTGYQLRFHPCLQKLSAVIASGALGNLLGVRCVTGEYMPGWHPYEDYREAYAAKADEGGGVILTQIHEIDYLYSLFGAPESVYALGGHYSDLELTCEDTASILMQGKTQTGRSLPIHLHMDYLQSPQNKQCEVIGDRGRAVMDLVGTTVTVFSQKSAEAKVHSFPEFERNQLFLAQTKHFLECVEARQKPMVDLKDGLESVRIALAAKQSIESGEKVSLGTSASSTISL